MPKRSWPFCQTSSDPSEIHDLSTSFIYESLGITWCHPDSCFLSKTSLGIEKMVLFCNQPLFTWIFFCDLDSAFTLYSVFEWVMFVAICQARFWEGTLKRWSRIHVILLIDLWIHFVGMGVEFFCCAVCAHLRKIFVWRFVLFMIFYGVVVLLCFFFVDIAFDFLFLFPTTLGFRWFI